MNSVSLLLHIAYLSLHILKVDHKLKALPIGQRGHRNQISNRDVGGYELELYLKTSIFHHS